MQAPHSLLARNQQAQHRGTSPKGQQVFPKLFAVSLRRWVNSTRLIVQCSVSSPGWHPQHGARCRSIYTDLSFTHSKCPAIKWEGEQISRLPVLKGVFQLTIALSRNGALGNGEWNHLRRNGRMGDPFFLVKRCHGTPLVPAVSQQQAVHAPELLLTPLSAVLVGLKDWNTPICGSISAEAPAWPQCLHSCGEVPSLQLAVCCQHPIMRARLFKSIAINFFLLSPMIGNAAGLQQHGGWGFCFI